MSGLRIIGGKAKGLRLRAVPGDTTRPITDRTKESLFNIIGGDIHGSIFLDMFGGTGSVGIEALSRGASHVRFLDLERLATQTIRLNLEKAGFLSTAEVIRTDALQYLGRAPDRQFDYIYIAPPQYKEMWRKALQRLDKNPGWLAHDFWVIVQIHPKEYESLVFDHLIEFDKRQYGSTLLIFYEGADSAEEV